MPEEVESIEERKVRESIQRGLEQSARGETESLGDLSEFLEEPKKE